ncbi:MAG: hypothetical protein ABSG86_20690 [Thermoguttaceae bacterium]
MLEEAVSVPEGTEVTVVVATPQATSGDVLPEAERRRIQEIMDHIAALPLEGDQEPFSGADHDKVLYGKP